MARARPRRTTFDTRVRAGEGEAESAAYLRELVDKDDAYLDQIAIGSRTLFRFYGVKLADRLPPLCFPSVGIAALPVVGARAIMFQPTSLSTFFATIPIEVPEHLCQRSVASAHGDRRRRGVLGRVDLRSGHLAAVPIESTPTRAIFDRS